MQRNMRTQATSQLGLVLEVQAESVRIMMGACDLGNSCHHMPMRQSRRRGKLPLKDQVTSTAIMAFPL